MADHTTPTLLFRLLLPSFAVVETDDIGCATRVVHGGGCAHVSTRELAAAVLTTLGLDTEAVEDRPNLATTGQIRWPY